MGFNSGFKGLNIAPSRIYKRCFVTSEEKGCRNRTGSYFILPSFPVLRLFCTPSLSFLWSALREGIEWYLLTPWSRVLLEKL